MKRIKWEKPVPKAKLLRILKLAKEVLRRHGQRGPLPYSKDYTGRRIWLRVGTANPFETFYSVCALSRTRNIIVVREIGGKLVDEGCEPWATIALNELEGILVLESLAKI